MDFGILRGSWNQLPHDTEWQVVLLNYFLNENRCLMSFFKKTILVPLQQNINPLQVRAIDSILPFRPPERVNTVTSHF